MGGGGLNLPLPPFLFVKSIEKVIRFFLSGSFKDMGIFHAFQLSFDWGGGVYLPIRKMSNPN